MVRRVVVVVAFPVSVSTVDQLVLEHVAKTEGSTFGFFLLIATQVCLMAPYKTRFRGRLGYLSYTGSTNGVYLWFRATRTIGI